MDHRASPSDIRPPASRANRFALTSAGCPTDKELVLFFKSLLYLSSFAAAVAPQADPFAVIEPAVSSIGDDWPAAPQLRP